MYSKSGFEMNIRTESVPIENAKNCIVFTHDMDLAPAPGITVKGRRQKGYWDVTPLANLNDLMLGYNAKLVSLLKKCQKFVSHIYIHPVQGSLASKATVLVDATITLNYVGKAGNDFKVEITESKGTHTLRVTKKDAVIESITLKKLEDINTYSNLVRITGHAKKELAAVEATPLSGGTSATMTVGTYGDFLTKIEHLADAVIVTPLVENKLSDVDTLTLNTVKSLREGFQNIRMVTHGNERFADTPYANTVFNGFVDSTNTLWTRENAKLMYACLSAGTSPKNSNTNADISALFGAVELDRDYTRKELSDAESKGAICFIQRRFDEVRLSGDVTNFIQSGESLVQDMFMTTKAQVTVDYIIGDIRDQFETEMKGKVPCNQRSAQTYEDSIFGKLKGWEKDIIIEEVTRSDVQVTIVAKNAFKLLLGLQPVDSLEKLFVEVVLKN